MQDDALDLDRYLARIGFDGRVEPTLDVLQGLQLRHLDRIPFENVDVRLRTPVRLDLQSLQEKLVRRPRGGYCFEQNSLFAAVLATIGFQVTTLEARVRPPGAEAPLPRTHMALTVAVGGRDWLVDVGFGGDGPMEPVPLHGDVSEQWDGSYRVMVGENGVLVLQAHRPDEGGWRDLYACSPRPALPIDFEVANHYTSTHPSSIFTRTLTVQRSSPGARRILRGDLYLVREHGNESRREIDADELPNLLRDELAIGLEPAELEALALAAR